MPARCAVIAIEAAIDEANLAMLASGNVPASQQYPHEGMGWDHASMNFFQQQTGYAWAPANYGRPVAPAVATMQQSTMQSPNGWGTPAELMNAGAATLKFLAVLARVDWQHMTNWQAAQAVQGSAFADGSNYRRYDAQAQRIVAALWPTIHQEEDVATIYRGPESYDVPVLVDGSTKVLVTNTSDAAALIAAGVRQVKLPSVATYNKIRKGAA
jgi:hypothetical protein